MIYGKNTVSQLILDKTVENVGRQQMLEAELFHRRVQLQNFHLRKESLVSKKIDVQSTYNRLVELYDQTTRKLQNIVSHNEYRSDVETKTGFTIPHRAQLLNEDLVSVEFSPDNSSILYGFGGFVQMPRAEDGISVTPDHPDLEGELVTIERRVSGGILFNGRIGDTRKGIPVDEYDPTTTFVWLRNWKYLVLFPPPSQRSRFTYQFDVATRASLFNESSPATFMSFISVGEEPNYRIGAEIAVDVGAGWPLVADLTQPNISTGWYNGRYGFLEGQTTVQRSFMVNANDSPAVAVVVGAIGITSMLGHTTYDFAGTGYSSITPRHQDGNEGRIAFHYAPNLLLAL